jgi:single-strand DNA-binding protein
MLNKVIIMGRLTKDPDFKQTQSGIAMCKFSVAVERQFKDSKTGERLTDFLDCTAFRGTAEFISRYFSKGNMILVEGNIQNNNYTDNNGVKHYSNNIMVENVSFCGGKNEGGTTQTVQEQPGLPENVQNAVEQFEAVVADPDSVPF